MLGTHADYCVIVSDMVLITMSIVVESPSGKQAKTGKALPVLACLGFGPNHPRQSDLCLHECMLSTHADYCVIASDLVLITMSILVESPSRKQAKTGKALPVLGCFSLFLPVLACFSLLRNRQKQANLRRPKLCECVG